MFRTLFVTLLLLSCGLIAAVSFVPYDRPKDILRATKAGAVDYIIKPFEPEYLTARVRALLISS